MIIVVGGVAPVALVVRMLWHKLQHTWESAKEGGAILAHPRRFAVEVVGVEAISYAARMGVNATFMYAFDIPVSVENVFLIVAAASVSSTVAVRRVPSARRRPWPRWCSRGSLRSRDQRLLGRSAGDHHRLERGLRPHPAGATEIGWKAVRGMIHTRKHKSDADGDAATGISPDPSVTPTPPE